MHPTGTIRTVRVTIACLLVSVALFAQDPRATRLTRSEETSLARVLDDAVRRRRSGDASAQWDGHFLRGPEGRTYVPYTLRLQRAGGELASVAIGVRVVGWNYVFSDAFGAKTETDGDDRVFRGAFMLQQGRCTVYLAIRDRDGRSSRVILAERVVVVPGFEGKDLRLSSVMVVSRVESQPEELPGTAPVARPYLLGKVLLVPARESVFSRSDSLTVAFQVYNAAMFEDGRPDVEVNYRVFRDGRDGRAMGATAPQLFDQETLPEEFSMKAGHQLTPVQSLPLARFEPGEYKLRIDVDDHLGRAHARAEVPFTVVQ